MSKRGAKKTESTEEKNDAEPTPTPGVTPVTEIMFCSTDVHGLAAFLAKAFEATHMTFPGFEDMPMINFGTKMSAMAMAKGEELQSSVPYVTVASIKGEITRLKKLGAKVSSPPKEVPNMGTWAHIQVRRPLDQRLLQAEESPILLLNPSLHVCPRSCSFLVTNLIISAAPWWPQFRLVGKR